MRSFDEYRNLYPNIHMERTDGIIHVALHSNGGPYVHCAAGHSDIRTRSTTSRPIGRTGS